MPDMIPLFKVFMSKSVDAPLLSVLHSGYIGEGERVKEFEKSLAGYLGSDHIVTCNSGTSALHMAYQMAQSPDSARGYHNSNDHEIISTPITCTATNTPIIASGAKIVWADVDPLTGNISPDSIRERITKNTKAVVMVHWGGNPCDIQAINDIAKKKGLFTVEDGAHSMGMEYQGRMIGSHSDFTMLSLQAIKHVTSVDGGVLITREKRFYERARLLRWYGIDRTIREGIDLRCELDVVEAGYKFHMNDICATIGNENLKHIVEILEKHRANAKFYDEAFSSSSCISVVPENDRGRSAYWLYTLHVENRDECMALLNKAGVMSSKVHARNDTHSMFKDFARELPGVARFNETHLCIPVGWWVSADEREYIAEQVLKYAK